MMHKCNTCNKDFTHKKNLKRHMKNIHSQIMITDSKCNANKEAKNKCPVCQLGFAVRSSLRRHERTKHKMNITASLRKSKFSKSKCITFDRSNLEDYPLLKKLIPEDYVYKINFIEDLKNDDVRAKFEIADCDENMFLDWLSKLETKSVVTYRVKSFTKSPSPKIVFNKVYRCIHNTFPNKFCIPHPKHTGCPGTLTVRITKCSEALSVNNSKADNNVILIPLKAIVTLNHCHNHVSLRSTQEYSTEKENISVHCNKQYYKIFENILNTENNLNNTYLDESSNLKSSSLEGYITDDDGQKNNTSNVEEILLYESDNNTFETNDNIQNITHINDKFELSEEFDDYILVENVNTDNSFNNDNENELCQLLLDYDTTHEKMIQQFQSNPDYFMSAIKTYTSVMKDKLTSKDSLLAVLNSFGKNKQI